MAQMDHDVNSMYVTAIVLIVAYVKWTIEDSPLANAEVISVAFVVRYRMQGTCVSHTVSSVVSCMFL
jgi:hypothetical protein